MPKSASDVMQDVLIDAIVEAIEALKAGSGGLPNQLLRDVQAIHRNAAYADLPKALQDSVSQSVRRGPPQDRRFVRKGPGRRGNDRPGGGGPGKGPRGPRPGGGGKPKA